MAWIMREQGTGLLEGAEKPPEEGG